jgi:hypothetical protein
LTDPAACPSGHARFAPNFNIRRQSMSFNKNTQFNRMRKPAKRVLVGETPEEEAARLAREIAAHPVTKCEPGERNPVSSRPGWSNKPFIPLADRITAEGIAKKMMKKG